MQKPTPVPTATAPASPAAPRCRALYLPAVRCDVGCTPAQMSNVRNVHNNAPATPATVSAFVCLRKFAALRASARPLPARPAIDTVTYRLCPCTARGAPPRAPAPLPCHAPPLVGTLRAYLCPLELLNRADLRMRWACRSTKAFPAGRQVFTMRVGRKEL